MLGVIAGTAALIGSTVLAPSPALHAEALPQGLAPVGHEHRVGTPVKTAAEPATLTTQVIDRYGKPGASASGHAINLKTGDGEFLRFSGDTAKTELEPGTYDVSVLSHATAPDGTFEVTAVTNRQVEVTPEGGLTTVDARPAKPVTAKVDRRGATVVDSAVTVGTVVGDVGLVNTFFTGPDARVYAVPTTPVTDRTQVFVYRPTLGGADFRYHLLHTHVGTLPDAPVYYTPDRRLARFDTTYYGQGRAVEGLEGNSGSPAVLPLPRIFRYFDLPFPSKRTEYYTADPNVTWYQLRVLDSEAAITNSPLTPGIKKSSWFRPPVQTAWGNGISRDGDQLTMSVQPFAPADGKQYLTGFGSGDPGKTVLLKDGQEIGTSETVGEAQFTLPGERGRYTLRTSGTREAPYSNLDTTVFTEWSFDSATSTGKLPLSLVRLGVQAQNELGQVKTGSNHEVTLAADPQPGSAATRTGIPSLELSYDEGKTWRRAFVGWGGQRGNAWLVEPRTPGFVSMRISATNSDGTKFTQTLIRAYELVP